jgi:methionine-rich copper-binding protein CopC
MKKILSSIAALSLSLAAIIGVSSPAQAHNDELTTSPAQGQTVEAGRIPITLTFGEELLTGDESINHEIIVTNEANEIVPALCASAKGFELSTAVALDQPGKYTVTWRTVSSDGHPVDGTFDFKVVNTKDYDAASDAVDACVTAQLYENNPSAEPMPVDMPLMARDANAQDSQATAWIIGISLLLAGAIAFFVVRFFRGKKANK